MLRLGLTRVLLVLYPELRISSLKVVGLLGEVARGFRAILLNLPSEMEDAVRGLALGESSYEELLEEVHREGYIPEPLEAWEYTFRPILEALPRIHYPELQVRCYGGREEEFARVEGAVRIAQLTLRTALRGEVELDEWRDALIQSISLDRDSIVEEARRIRGLVQGDSICLAEVGGRSLKGLLTASGLVVRVHYVERPYHFAPLAILKRRMARGYVDDRELERLVRCHVDYIRRYIYRFESRDRAHYEWTYENIPWLRRWLRREEIEALSRIIG